MNRIEVRYQFNHWSGYTHREDIILGHFNEAALQILC